MKAFEDNKVFYINRQTLFLFFASLCVNFVFLYFYHHNDYYLGILGGQGEVAYSVYKHNSIKICSRLSTAKKTKHQEPGRMIDHAEIDHSSYGPPTHYHSVNDTIGYGVLLGLLWENRAIVHNLSSSEASEK